MNQMGKFIYQLIYRRPMANRSPNLDTILMIEKVIRDHGGEFNRRQVWQNLPKKVMWQTFVKAYDYLLDSHKIAEDRLGHVCWIWNPELVDKIMSRPDLRVR